MCGITVTTCTDKIDFSTRINPLDIKKKINEKIDFKGFIDAANDQKQSRLGS